MSEYIMVEKTSATHWVKLYLSGPIEIAKQVIREDALRQGICVTIEPTLYMYTGGEEHGYVVGLLNYPRFPLSVDELNERGRMLLRRLLQATHQQSALMMTPDVTEWISIRPENA